MTVLLYDYIQLEERSSRKLKVWKAWHTILYALAAVFGIMNYVFLQNTMELVGNNCVLTPRQLEFHWVELPDEDIAKIAAMRNSTRTIQTTRTKDETNDTNSEGNAQITTPVPGNKSEELMKVKREADDTLLDFNGNDTTIEEKNATVVVGNKTLMLDTLRSFYAKEGDCQYAEYMPIMSMIVAIIWTTLFIMCPGGGRTRTGLQQPYRILAPALIAALVMVGLTGHSFTLTNGGLHDFCAAFQNYTNATTCSAANLFLLNVWNSTWGLGGRVAATRAASAGVWATWACACALLVARCLVAPDFTVRRTGAYLVDPQQKILPRPQKSPNRCRSSPRSPSQRSEPTNTTDVVISMENAPNSDSSSLSASPSRRPEAGEAFELTNSPRLGHKP